MVSPAPGQYITVYCFLGHAAVATLSSHLPLLSLPSCSPAAYKHADGKKIDGRRVLVDVERGRTVKGWRPRRLGQHPFFFFPQSSFICKALNHNQRCPKGLDTEENQFWILKLGSGHCELHGSVVGLQSLSVDGATWRGDMETATISSISLSARLN